MLREAAGDTALGSITMYQVPGETLRRLSLSGSHEQSWELSTIAVPIVQLRELRP